VGCSGVLEIEVWGCLVSLVSRVPNDYSNLYRQLNTTSSNFYSVDDARYASREIFASNACLSPDLMCQR
jgi:hypothetical protein